MVRAAWRPSAAEADAIARLASTHFGLGNRATDGNLFSSAEELFDV